jgi:DNA-binding winged helix-turn-helix (wHTH) protein
MPNGLKFTTEGSLVWSGERVFTPPSFFLARIIPKLFPVPISFTMRQMYEFGAFRADPAEQLLLHEGQPVALTPKVFETLLILLESEGRLIDKDDFISRLWPGVFVEEAALAKNIFHLRKVLAAGNGASEMIQTVPKRGYRFIAAVRKVVDGPAQSFAVSAQAEKARQGAGKYWKVVVAGFVSVLVLALCSYFYLRLRSRFNTAKLTNKDTVVLADFANSTGDPVFDSTLRQGLAIGLEQSPFLKIMDDAQVKQGLRLMGLPPGARLADQTLHEICVREGAAATIEGTIASLGKSYVITLQAIGCKDGATLAREQIQAVHKEDVLHAVGTAATAMRAKLGESNRSVQKWSRPLEQATTPSLEALQNFTAGYDEITQGHFLASIPLAQRL